MIAIRDRSLVRIGANQISAAQLFELLQAGSEHWDPSVSDLFLKARQLASNAVSENSETSLVVSALLFHPCQALASGELRAGHWTSDSLLKTGTYDWLEENFGEEVAETIRLQPYAKRFLATVVPRYFSKLDSERQHGPPKSTRMRSPQSLGSPSRIVPLSSAIFSLSLLQGRWRCFQQASRDPV